MTERKKKLRIIQLILLALGSLIIFFTYYGEKKDFSEKILPQETQDKIKKQLADQSTEGDTSIIFLIVDWTYQEIDMFLNLKRLNLILKIKK